MDLKIFVPTRARVEKQVTLSRMPEKLRRQAFTVCPRDEASNHKEWKRNVLICDEKGIAATRDWIMWYAKKQGIKRLVMLDDDVVLQRRRKDMRITNADEKEYEGAFKWLDTKLKTFAHASWGTRFLAFAAEGEQLSPGRAMYALGYDVKKFFEAKAGFCKDMPRMPVMEDFHVTLQLLRAGHPNVVSLEWRASPYASNAPGGCSTWRNIKNHSDSAKRLAKLHPEFVKVRVADTEWKGEGMPEGEKRLEVTVQWQKAAKAGQHDHR